MSNATLFESNLKSLKFLHRGKVRDIYAVGDDKLLVIQSDRLSAFDVILPDPIPGKGEVLTAMSNYWFKKLGHVDLIVVGAPGPEQEALAWWRSVASGVTANAHCSVHVVRVPEAARATR